MVQITLSKRGNLNIKDFNYFKRAILALKNERCETFYTIVFEISDLPFGVYAVLLKKPYVMQGHHVLARGISKVCHENTIY